MIVAGGLAFAARSKAVEAIGAWTQLWTDLLTFDVVPVIDDEQMMRVIG